MVQAQNDFAAAVAGLNRARSRLTLTEIVEKQNRTLLRKQGRIAARASDRAGRCSRQARSEVRTAEAALEASRNRLGLLGKTDDEIATFQDKGKINPETPIYAPIAGTVVQRKVGPGQYVSYTSTGSVDPVFTIGDLSTVWLVAYVRESEAHEGARRPADSNSPCWPTRTPSSKPRSTTSRPRSIRRHAG